MKKTSKQSSLALQGREKPAAPAQESQASISPTTRFVDHLPDLITEEDYQDAPKKKKIRIQISLTGDGVEILGDTMHAPVLEALLGETGAKEIQKMPCG